MRGEDRRAKAGRLAQDYVERELGLKEPEVEVKAVAKHEGKAVIRVAQLEKAANENKTYIFVIYDVFAKRKKSRTPQTRTGRSWDAAFGKEAEIEIIRLAARTLALCIRQLSPKLLYIERGERWGQFKVKVPVARLREAAGEEFIPF